MRLGWKQTQPNNSHVDAQTDISLPHALTAPLAMFPAWNFRTPAARMTAVTALSFGQQSAEPNQNLPYPTIVCFAPNVLQGDEIQKATLLFPPPKSRLESITRVMKQPRGLATLVLSFAASRRLVAAFQPVAVGSHP